MILFWVVLCLFVTNHAYALEPGWPGAAWEEKTPAQMGMNEQYLAAARDYALTGGGSGIVIRGGYKVFSWGDQQLTYDLKSTSKSIGVTALGLALLDGKVHLEDPASLHHPGFGVSPDSNTTQSEWLSRITLHQLANQTAGFAKPGGYQPLLFEPGTQWSYSDGGPNWLAECLTLACGVDMETLLFNRLFTRIGITHDDLHWRNNAYRDHMIKGMKRCEFGSGVNANVSAMARIGLLYLRNGRWRDEQLLPKSFVEAAGRLDPDIEGLNVLNPEHYGRASHHYGLLWWNNADGTLKNVPRDAYWTWGLYESFIIVMPNLDLVVARTGKSWRREEGSSHYDVLPPFMDNVVRSVERVVWNPVPPYPPCPVITGVQWADTTEIIRLAEGSDIWSMTWGDDDLLYTAYGDGWGFTPRVDRKLSLGLARIGGSPGSLKTENIRSESGEEFGEGDRGIKSSGMLMVDGVLYMWCRNAGNSELRWSTDRGVTWTRCNWKFNVAFGAPTFLNYGKNYAGARDNYVYVYSHDHDSAYYPSDRMNLARVPKDRLRERSAYTFFAGFDAAGTPRWTAAIEDREAVFEHPLRCYRSGITYNAALGRYLWCQTLGGMDDRSAGGLQRGPRFNGGLGIFDAPEPWGPWTTVYYAPLWDTGPGETSSLPVKWMSADGKTCWLVFSGNDCFSARKVQLTVK